MPSVLKVGAVHASPVYMNKDASIQKAIDLIQSAATQGVDLVVFPEAFIPGYPIYIMAYPPLQCAGLLAEYSRQSFSVFDHSGSSPQLSEDLKVLQSACKASKVTAVINVSEKSGFSPHTLFLSQIFISCEGELLGIHRKMMPTYAEKSIFAQGGGATLKCWDSPMPNRATESSPATYKLGGLSCGENGMYGANQALILQGEQVHAASWPAMCAYRPMKSSYADRIKTLSKSHAYVSGAFVIAASTIIKQDHLDCVEEHLGPDVANVLVEGSGWSGIVDPGKGVIDEDDGMEERILVAEIDLDSVDVAKVFSDPAGHYRRPEVLKLEVNKSPIWDDDQLLADGGRNVAEPEPVASP